MWPSLYHCVIGKKLWCGKLTTGNLEFLGREFPRTLMGCDPAWVVHTGTGPQPMPYNLAAAARNFHCHPAFDSGDWGISLISDPR